MSNTTVAISNSFKRTEKCLLPEDWDVVTLEDVCAKAINGGTPSTEVEKYWEGDIPWITGADIINQKVSKIRRYITEEAVRNSSTNVIPKGNLLVVTRTGVGKLAIAPFDVAVSQDFTGIIPNGKIKTEFLFWLLNNSANYFLDLTQGTSINGITRKDLMGFVSPIPPLPEQHHIAEILSTVDRAIEQTEAIIAKQQRIKTGLMQDLLTRGIDEHGNIRSEETHKFKDSPLGRIPVEWDVATVGAIIDGIDGGWSPRCYDETPTADEWGVLKVSAVSSGTYDPAESKRLPTSLIPILSLEVRPGDVLLCRSNGVAELVGRCVLVEHTPHRLMLSDKTLRLHPTGTHVTGAVLTLLLMSHPSRLQILAALNGSSGQKNISQEQIRGVRVQLPPLPEQEAIQNVLATSSTQLADCRASLIKLRSLKTALMQDLLTGRKRVTTLLNDTEEQAYA